MNTNEFKKILKPLIEKTVREVLLEQGILSNIVSEVAKGLQGNIVKEDNLREKERIYERQRQERIKKLNETASIGKSVFDDVAPVKESNGTSPLAGVDSSDPGIDISAIQKLSRGKWKALAGGK